MNLFKRIFKMGQAEAHSLADKLEDPIKLTEQGIRDMKVDLDKSIKSLAEVKAMAIRAKNETQNYKNQVAEYEKKAILLLQKAENGQLEPTEADRLAASALEKKEQAASNYKTSQTNQQKFEVSVSKLESTVGELKNNISKWENEAKTLKARAKVSAASQNVNKQMAQLDSSSTVAMLERMKEKVEQQEALSESYADLADSSKSLDDEIESALGSSSGSDALAALKAKMANKELGE